MTEGNASDPAQDYLRWIAAGPSTPVKLFTPADDSLTALLAEIGERVLGFARPKGDPELAAALASDRVAVRSIPQTNVYAITVRSGASHVIAVNHGLAMFVYKLARAIAPHMTGPHPEYAPPPGLDETAGRIATLIDWMGSLARTPRSGDWEMTPPWLSVADNITTAAERFVLSHEIGHIMAGHAAQDVEHDGWGLNPAEMGRWTVAEENFADGVATMLTIESMSAEGIDPRAGCVGIVMFLRCAILAQTVGALVVDDTHPSAEDRLHLVHATITMRYGADADVLLSWSRELGALLDDVGARALLERDRRRVAAEAEMRDVFHETSWSYRSGEGKVALVERMVELLKDSPSAVLDAIHEHLLDVAALEAALRRASAFRDPLDDEAYRGHRIALFLAAALPADLRGVLGLTMPGAATWITPDT